ncbi:uncharacterized protein LOC135395074 [Ornithodoros turicata]|uniref:Putative conserved plasma membrane protein n=1 Tax=Ornithodoros turicata TaxID=34597 RepID=A0A2R5LD48_9ACAR
MPSTLDRSRQQWFRRRPLLRTAYITDLQYGSYIAGIYSIVESIFMIFLAIFDIYCLAEASPGSRHYRYIGFSFLFVYSGNQHVRHLLILCSIISFIVSVCLLATSVMMVVALRKEQEAKFRPWLLFMFLFTSWRVVAIIYRSIVNDLYFSYHQAMLVIWILFILINGFAWLVVYSNYQELTDITRLEDMAKLKMGTLSSLNASRSVSRHSIDSMKNTSLHNTSFQSTTSAKVSLSTASA